MHKNRFTMVVKNKPLLEVPIMFLHCCCIIYPRNNWRKGTYEKKLVTYLLTIVLILSCVWLDPIRSYGQTEDEISSAEDVSNTEADQESFEKSETDSVDDEELNNDVEKNAGVPLENASSGSEEVLA